MGGRWRPSPARPPCCGTRKRAGRRPGWPRRPAASSSPPRSTRPACCWPPTEPAGELLAVGHEDGAVRVWRVGTGEELFRWRPAAKAVRRLAFTADGAELVGVVEGSADLPVLRLGVLRRELAAVGLGW